LTMNQPKKLYSKKGQLAGSVGAIVMLVIGVGVAVLVLIFIGVLGGQTYNLVEPQINDLYGNVADEAFEGTLNDVVQLAHQGIESGTLVIGNASNGIALGNFTVNYAEGQVTLL